MFLPHCEWPSFTPICNNVQNYSSVYLNLIFRQQSGRQKFCTKWQQAFRDFHLLLISSGIEFWCIRVLPKYLNGSKSWCVPFNFKPSQFTWTLLLAYPEAQLMAMAIKHLPVSNQINHNGHIDRRHNHWEYRNDFEACLQNRRKRLLASSCVCQSICLSIHMEQLSSH